jgi:DNA primase
LLSFLSSGRVVLCLDNDDAGIAAVERLCSGGMLEKAASAHQVQFGVANLPPGIKDPGDFAEKRRSGIKLNVTELRVAFCEEVLDSAEEWSDWYLERLLCRCDTGSTRQQLMTKGLGETFQKVADFLSTFSNPADRTKSASLVAGKMAIMIAKKSNATEVSKAVRLQLESDLIDMAAKKASEREQAWKRRNDLGSTSQVPGLLFTRDSPSKDSVDVSKLSREALIKLNGRDTAPSRISPRPRGYQSIETRKQQVPPLVPHFDGFRFANPNDADWLGMPRNVVS